MADYRFRIWVKLVGISELFVASLDLVVALTMLLIVISASWGWQAGRLGQMVLELVSHFDTITFLAVLENNVDRSSIAAHLLLMGITFLLYLVQVIISICLVRGCANGLDPARAFGLLRIWRNWTLVLMGVRGLDYTKKPAELLNHGYLIVVGVNLFELVLVAYFIHEVKEKSRAERRGASPEEMVLKDDQQSVKIYVPK